MYLTKISKHKKTHFLGKIPHKSKNSHQQNMFIFLIYIEIWKCCRNRPILWGDIANLWFPLNVENLRRRFVFEKYEPNEKNVLKKSLLPFDLQKVSNIKSLRLSKSLPQMLTATIVIRSQSGAPITIFWSNNYWSCNIWEWGIFIYFS